MKQFLTELKRRQIYKFGVIYLAAAWLLTQVAVTVKGPLNLPDGTDTLVIVLLALGFPAVLIAAWARESGRGAASSTDLATTGARSPREQLKPVGGDVRFCRTPDGYRLAYARFGSGEPPLLRTGNWVSHIEAEWDNPLYQPMLRDLSSEFEMITYDGRGTGLADRNVGEFSLDSMVEDMETVADANALDRFAILAYSQSCAVAVAYAVRHPERVTGMVLHAGFLRNFRKPEEIAAITALLEQNWGQSNPATRQFFTSSLWPDATREEYDAFNEMQRKSLEPETAALLFRTCHGFDVTELAEQVSVPTLVMHSRDEQGVPLECSREAASLIPNARLVVLDSNSHLVLERETAYRQFIDETVSFLRSTLD